jgi:hypothetical protein
VSVSDACRGPVGSRNNSRPSGAVIATKSAPASDQTRIRSAPARLPCMVNGDRRLGGRGPLPEERRGVRDAPRRVTPQADVRDGPPGQPISPLSANSLAEPTDRCVAGSSRLANIRCRQPRAVGAHRLHPGRGWRVDRSSIGPARRWLTPQAERRRRDKSSPQLCALADAAEGARYLIATGLTGDPTPPTNGCGDASRRNS